MKILLIISLAFSYLIGGECTGAQPPCTVTMTPIGEPELVSQTEIPPVFEETLVQRFANCTLISISTYIAVNNKYQQSYSMVWGGGNDANGCPCPTSPSSCEITSYKKFKKLLDKQVGNCIPDNVA